MGHIHHHLWGLGNVERRRREENVIARGQRGKRQQYVFWIWHVPHIHEVTTAVSSHTRPAQDRLPRGLLNVSVAVGVGLPFLGGLATKLPMSHSVTNFPSMLIQAGLMKLGWSCTHNRHEGERICGKEKFWSQGGRVWEGVEWLTTAL